MSDARIRGGSPQTASHRRCSEETKTAVFDEAWSAIQHSEAIEIKTVRRKLSIHELRAFLRLILTPHINTLGALRRLAFAARTSGGTAGRDDFLCAACDEAEGLVAGRDGRGSEQRERVAPPNAPEDQG